MQSELDQSLPPEIKAIVNASKKLCEALDERDRLIAAAIANGVSDQPGLPILLGEVINSSERATLCCACAGTDSLMDCLRCGRPVGGDYLHPNCKGAGVPVINARRWALTGRPANQGCWSTQDSLPLNHTRVIVQEKLGFQHYLTETGWILHDSSDEDFEWSDEDDIEGGAPSSPGQGGGDSRDGNPIYFFRITSHPNNEEIVDAEFEAQIKRWKQVRT